MYVDQLQLCTSFHLFCNGSSVLCYNCNLFFSILGHEGVVEVIEHKCPHNDLNVGDRLTFTIADFCHDCERCESDLPQKCFSLFKVCSVFITMVIELRHDVFIFTSPCWGFGIVGVECTSALLSY